VTRYKCPTCGQGFSTQTFACTYYLKRPEYLRPIAAGLVAGSAHRQIARSLGCAPSTMERGFLFIVWRNFVKKVSERTNEAITPAMRLGLVPRPLEWREVFSQRLFPGRIPLPRGWMKVYRRGWITPAVGRNVAHVLVHAF
jgi:hypothetical protein